MILITINGYLIAKEENFVDGMAMFFISSTGKIMDLKSEIFEIQLENFDQDHKIQIFSLKRELLGLV